VAFESVNINQVAQDAMAIVEHQLEINKVKLNRNLAPDIPAISGNANQIQQVLINLMINAQQAMEGNPGKIEVATHNSNSNHVEVLIKDDGPGIPKDLQTKIFEPFFTTKEVGKGTGLGLSVSYGIIKEHKGDIQVESSPETGTTFKISFPTTGLKTVCPTCKQPYSIRKNQIGLKNKCKKCGSIFRIQ